MLSGLKKEEKRETLSWMGTLASKGSGGGGEDDELGGDFAGGACFGEAMGGRGEREGEESFPPIPKLRFKASMKSGGKTRRSFHTSIT